MNEGMFLALWTKYLPVIRIVLKKSVNEEQQVTLNKMEFQAVDNRKNANHSFDLSIVNGKAEKGVGFAAIGKDLFNILNNDLAVNNFMADKTITIKMGKSNQLTIKSDVIEPVILEEEIA